MPEYVPRWISPANHAETPSDATDKTDKSPSVGFVSASERDLLRANSIPGLDPALRWVHVYRGPVKASTPPAGWEGVAPAGCGVPNACRALGPCPHFTAHGCCWAEGDRS
jgi:hypothetical protein